MFSPTVQTLPALMLSVLHTKVLCLQFTSNITIQYILFPVKRDALKLAGRVAAVQLRPMAQLASVSILHGPASVCSTVPAGRPANPGILSQAADQMVGWTPRVFAASVPRKRADWWERSVLHYCVAAARPTCVA